MGLHTPGFIKDVGKGLGVVSGIGLISSTIGLLPAVLGGLGYMGYAEQRKAAAAQNEANRVSANQQKISQINERRNAARAAAIKRAAMIAAAANTGGIGSSALAGAEGGQATIEGSNQAQLQGAFVASDVVSSLSAEAANHSAKAEAYGQAMNLTMNLTSMAMAFV